MLIRLNLDSNENYVAAIIIYRGKPSTAAVQMTTTK